MTEWEAAVRAGAVRACSKVAEPTPSCCSAVSNSATSQFCQLTAKLSPKTLSYSGLPGCCVLPRCLNIWGWHKGGSSCHTCGSGAEGGCRACLRHLRQIPDVHLQAPSQPSGGQVLFPGLGLSLHASSEESLWQMLEESCRFFFKRFKSFKKL